MKSIHGAASYQLESDRVRLAIARAGGHLAPVEFRLGGHQVSPYALAPWQPGEVDPELPVLLKSLRGDFLCLPFGPQENGPPHGETANGDWQEIGRSDHSLTLEIQATDVGARVTKTIELKPGQTAIYLEHQIDGLVGDFNYGSHPILDLSSEKNGRISVSPFRWASVYPGFFSDPADGASQALKPGTHFADLSCVPLESGGETDLTRFPARAGNDDLVMMVNEPSTPEQPFAWSAVSLEGYVWLCLKNPADFPSTLLWLSNGGRSAAPWNGRHVGKLGVEEVCSHFCDGPAISRQDLLAKDRIPTSRHFTGDRVNLRLIQAVAAIPENFGRVTRIVPAGDRQIRIVGETGCEVIESIDWRYVI
ncbi:hypothetical protein JIN85_11940 [Luteolibacter pohnpeiensis]|uniref:DUF4432 domain-containing protein n=1 Tax=Luteolibacter pohnpeiensis TaxID=454153 RepID=A0A934VV26_9BACT|nr:hypothetical protein [Luteolibacter pohnpeiensis]MBK1883132.1 hypothetical protein [Luteolibacter pohnpeiensis]